MATTTPDTVPPVVVGVDGSPFALDATRWAAGEAARRGVGLRLVTAVGRQARRLRGHRPDPDQLESLLETARSALTEASAAATEAVPGIATTTEVLDGHPLPELVAASEHAALVVIGDRGQGGVAGLPAGSVAIGLAAQAVSPVVVVRGVPRPPDSPVVVGVEERKTDGTGSDALLAFAFAAAQSRRVPLVTVHAYVDETLMATGRAALHREAIESHQQELLGEQLAPWIAKHPDVEVRTVITMTKPAPAIIEQSAAAQLVVVGSRGHGRFAGLLLGSVSHAVLHQAACPVAVVRPEPEHDESE